MKKVYSKLNSLGKTKLLVLIAGELIALFLLVTIVVMVSAGPSVGYWQVKEITAGDVVMTEKDGDNLGIKLGYFKLYRSRRCEVVLLEEEYKGKWEEKDGIITVHYGERTATGTVEGNDLTLTDDQTIIYKLHSDL